jgi:hypothetical protein
MEAIAIGIAIGAGAMLAIRHGKAGTKKVLGFAAKQAGFIAARVNSAVDSAKSVVREQYKRGREANLERIEEMPPLSTRINGKSIPPPPQATGTNGNGAHTAQPPS